MTTFEAMWQKLAKGKRYREEFALSMLKRMIPYQARAMRKKRGWLQAKLAEAAGLTQGAISRAEDPDYGNLTLNTIGRIAAGFDVAAIVKFVPFSQLVKTSGTLSESEFANMLTFEQEVSQGFPERFGSMNDLLDAPKKAVQREKAQEEKRDYAEEAVRGRKIVEITSGRNSGPGDGFYQAGGGGGRNEIVINPPC